MEHYYSAPHAYRPSSAIQTAIDHQRGYFDFFQTYDGFIEANLLQDFVGKNLRAVADFRQYVEMANEIIDSRGRRFHVSA